MARQIPKTIIGNLTGNTELSFTPNGVPVLNFTIAENESKYDKQKNDWVDAGTTFYRATLWREKAEEFSESYKKGDPMIVVGYVSLVEYEGANGEKRRQLEVEPEAWGPNLRWGKTGGVQRSGGNRAGGGGQRQNSQPQNDPWASGGDPWGSAPAHSAPAEEPPF